MSLVVLTLRTCLLSPLARDFARISNNCLQMYLFYGELATKDG